MSAFAPSSSIILRTLIVFSCLGLSFLNAHAQYLPQRSHPAADAGSSPQAGSQNAREPLVPRWIVPVSSAIVPGSGQLLSGHDRGVLYLAAEGLLMLRFWSLRSEARSERVAYRDLAFTVARAPFRPARRDTVFEYFEAMESFVESGPYNTSSGPELVPPTDESTFNGHIWRLARETFLPDPDVPPDTSSEAYRRALGFYSARAVGANFQWSWRNAGLERDLFSQSIRRSDDAFRMATQFLGLVLVNHLVSTIDAFVTARLGDRASLQSVIDSGREQGRALLARTVLRVEF